MTSKKAQNASYILMKVVSYFLCFIGSVGNRIVFQKKGWVQMDPGRTDNVTLILSLRLSQN